jgi:hypothetical protein
MIFCAEFARPGGKIPDLEADMIWSLSAADLLA